MSGLERLKEILKDAKAQGASDIHFVSGDYVAYRINGIINFIDKWGIIEEEDLKNFIAPTLKDVHAKILEKNKSVDYSFGIPGVARFRVNLFYEKGKLSCVLRLLPEKIRSFEELGLPPVLKELCKKDFGLILVTGPTGSGKTTTLAAMIDYINENFPKHIITIEDPIEYVYKRKKSIVRQREVLTDTISFNQALKDALREDPDVILVGELRDKETIKTALTAAETGHLVFGTLHTNNAIETINRIVGVFDESEQNQILMELSFVLQGIISQRLLPSKKGGRKLVYEILIPNMPIRNLIRSNKIFQIYPLMQSGQKETGMITMNQRLVNLIKEGHIDLETASGVSPNPEELKHLLGKGQNIRNFGFSSQNPFSNKPPFGGR